MHKFILKYLCNILLDARKKSDYNNGNITKTVKRRVGRQKHYRESRQLRRDVSLCLLKMVSELRAELEKSI